MEILLIFGVVFVIGGFLLYTSYQEGKEKNKS
jgi:hypothetical protein